MLIFVVVLAESLSDVTMGRSGRHVSRWPANFGDLQWRQIYHWWSFDNGASLVHIGPTLLWWIFYSYILFNELIWKVRKSMTCPLRSSFQLFMRTCGASCIAISQSCAKRVNEANTTVSHTGDRQDSSMWMNMKLQRYQ